MNTETYLEDLTAHLQQRGVDNDKIRDIVSEAETHLAESGEGAVEAFGSVEEYAEKMAIHEEKLAVQTEKPNHLHRTFRATAFGEMAILEFAGREGWELVDVGALALYCRRPADENRVCRWEYKRRTGRHGKIILDEMVNAGWEPCGNWLPFHYFKREVTS